MYLDRNLCRNYTSKTNPLTHNTQAIVKAIFHTKPNQTAPPDFLPRSLQTHVSSRKIKPTKWISILQHHLMHLISAVIYSLNTTKYIIWSYRHQHLYVLCVQTFSGYISQSPNWLVPLQTFFWPLISISFSIDWFHYKQFSELCIFVSL